MIDMMDWVAQGREWRTVYDLPSRSPSVPSLSDSPLHCRWRREGSEEAQVRVLFDEALRLLGTDRRLIRRGRRRPAGA